MPERPWLLIPVKSLHLGKSRLEPALTPSARRQLNEFFLRHMTAVAAQFPGLDHTAVVSDADDTLTLSADLGARTIRTGRQDLNGALADACRELRRDGVARILILPVDLPLVEARDVRALVAAGEDRAVTISSDRDGLGTNALLLAQDVPLRFSFGASSYHRHQEEARRCGVTPLLYPNPRIAQDLDRPADIMLLGRTPAPKSWQVFRG